MAKKTTGTPATPRTAASPRRRTTTTASGRATAAEPAAAIGIATVGHIEEPTHDDIAREAYLRYLNRGAGDGLDFDDWLDAERALKNRNGG